MRNYSDITLLIDLILKIVPVVNQIKHKKLNRKQLVRCSRSQKYNMSKCKLKLFLFFFRDIFLQGSC